MIANMVLYELDIDRISPWLQNADDIVTN